MINEERRKIQVEALEALKANNFRGAVILPTGTGKSYVLIESLRTIYQQGMRVLYTCDSTKLRDSDFSKELSKWEAANFDDIIEKQCYAGAYKKQGEHYDILLADEGDYALTPEYSKLFFNNTFTYIIFVSATLDTKKRKMAKEIVPIVYQKKIKEIEEKKVVNKSQFIHVPYMLGADENRRYLSYNKRFKELIDSQPPPFLSLVKEKEWQDRRQKQLDFLSIQRKHWLAGLQSSVYICRRLMKELFDKDPTSRILIFCGLNAQADRVCKYSYHSGNAQEDNINKFDREEIPAVAVCGKVDRGANLNGVNKIIMETCNRSETKMIQRVGRGKRLDVDDILYVYVLVPYYITERGIKKPTIVQEWISVAAKDMGIENAIVHYVK